MGMTNLQLKAAEDSLAALLLSLIWVLPNHQLPWTTFHQELIAIIGLGFIFLLLAWQGRREIRLPAVGLLMLAVACLPWAQWYFGLLPKLGTAFISSSYVAAFGLAIIAGFSGDNAAGERLKCVMWLALVFAALINLPIQVAQWFQWYAKDMTSIWSIMVTPIGVGNRPSGTVLQPNLLATIQVFALVGATWLHINRRVGRILFITVFVLISAGLGLTQSRAGLIEMGVCAGFSALTFRKSADKQVCLVWLSVFSLLVIWSIYFKEVAAFFLVQSAEARLSTIDGARIDAWLAFSMSILDQPWLGYGLTDGGYPYLLQGHSHPEIYIGQRFVHAHNLVLDMALWFGIPLTLVLVCAGSWWGIMRLRESLSNKDLVFPLMALLAFGVHSMLELPHQYFFMLLPVGLCIGAIIRDSGGKEIFRGSARGMALVSVLIWSGAAAVSWDYFRYQERYTEWRFENLKIGVPLDNPINPPLVLTQLHDELMLYRMELPASPSPELLEWMEQTAQATATGPAIYYTIRALGVAGREDDALLWMKRYNAISTPEIVDAIRGIWMRDQKKYPQLADLEWPPYAGRRSTFRFEPEPLSNP
jgi:hypothetical protein